ncbi:hypothetical protein LXL04_014871 [Taraxacum kok-saghyz]
MASPQDPKPTGEQNPGIIENIVQTVTGTIGGAKDAVMGKAPEATEKTTEAEDFTGEKAVEGKDKTVDMVTTTKDYTIDKGTEGKDVVAGFVTELKGSN